MTDAWELRKLKDIGKIRTGNTPSTSKSENYSKNGIPWVTPTDINSPIIHNTAKHLSEIGVKKARIAKAGSILVTCIASIGKNTMVMRDSGFNQQINSVSPNEESDSYFLLTQSEQWSKMMKNIAAAGTMQIINKKEFSNLGFKFPNKVEQQKIGTLFKHLDSLITLHQCRTNLRYFYDIVQLFGWTL